MLPHLQKTINNKNILFTQTINHNTQNIIKKTKHLHNTIPNIIIKIPITSKNLTTIKLLKKKNITTLNTTIYNTTQKLLTTLTKTKYITPYINHINTQNKNNIHTIQKLQTLLKIHTPKNIILTTNFKTPHQTLNYLLTKYKSITLPLNITQQILNTPTIKSTIKKFKHN